MDCRETSRLLSCCQLPQTGKAHFSSLKGGCFATLLLQQKGEGSSVPATVQPMQDCYSAANEKPPHF